MNLEFQQKVGNVITVGRELTPHEKLKTKLKAKPFNTMTRAEKDELLELLVQKMLG